MPEFDARCALEIMQECQLEIPFIIVSGTIGEERAVKAMQDGASDYIMKDRLGTSGPGRDPCPQAADCRQQAAPRVRRGCIS